MRRYNICLAFTGPATPLLLPRCHWMKPQSPPCKNIGAMQASAANKSCGPAELEIEKKFAIRDEQSAKEMEQKLASLGFIISRREEFVDYYFDLPAPRWHFSLQDCWFRYREKKIKIMNDWGWRGAWQVKRGKKEEHTGARDNDGMTTYEEFQGKQAKELILAKLNALEALDDNTSGFDVTPPEFAYDIPHLAGAESLVPFARLETFRTCYTTAEGEFSNLKVDVDKTDFGYMVGEVEAVLTADGTNDKEQVIAAKEKIRQLVDLISECDNESDNASMAAMAGSGERISILPVLGKLEYYLINHSREHYDACVKAGILMN